jgi:hypothetical protein
MPLLLASLLALLLPSQDRREPVEPKLPWTVVGQPAPQRYDALYNPRLIVRADGSLIATVTHVGHYGSVIGTYVYRSTDGGSSWSKVATLFTPNDAGLFEVGGKLYLLGTYSSAGRSPGRAEICCSVDGGGTWEKMTLISREDRLNTSESEILRDHGRIWQLYSRTEISGGTSISHLSVASAPADSDLMKSESWTWSEELTQPGFGWHCSLLAPAGDRGPILLGRTYGEAVKFMADLTSDGSGVRVRSTGDCPELPDRWTRSLEREPLSAQTFVLKMVDRPQPEWGASEIRLVSSPDLAHWADRSVLLRDDRKDGVAFSWCTQAYDRDDLLAILCARVPGTPGPVSEDRGGWNVLFLRVPRFRERKPETPPLWDGSR